MSAFLIFPWVVSGQTLKPEEIYQKLIPSIVSLQVENDAGEKYVGSGFLALQDGVVVTAWHVVSDAARVSVKFQDEQVVQAVGIIDKDEQHDLTLLRVSAAAHPRAAISSATPPVGSRAYVIGSPKGFEFSITDGLLSQVQKVDGFTQFQVSCPISGGDSGGPLVNERGEIIGITCWTKKDAPGLSFATPASFLSRLNPSRPGLCRQWATNLTVAVTQPAKNEAEVRDRLLEQQVALKDLKSLLNKSAGREVTVVVIDGAEEKRFQIVVPENLLQK